MPVPASGNRVELDLLVGIDRARDTLLGQHPPVRAMACKANNALLWGARGMGKSSWSKPCMARCRLNILPLKTGGNAARGHELGRAPAEPPAWPRRTGFILFCDDLSFSHDDQHYKSLKAVLDGGIEGRPENVVFYATSNRRHLMPRDMIENERSSAINPSEAVEEKVSLSDRFGLWLGLPPLRSG